MRVKRCTGCGTEKELSAFSKHRLNKDGLQYQCRTCQAEYKREYRKNNKQKIAKTKREYYENNKEKIAASTRYYRQNNKEEIAEYKRKYYENNKEKIAESTRDYHQNNKEKIAKTKREYREANREKIAESQREYYEANKEKVAKRIRKYRKNNQGKRNAWQAKRRAAKLQATPNWLTEFDHDYIKSIYMQGAHLKMHVDHIIPLQGKTVCGLHVPWNLQLLEPEENIRKSNKIID